MYDTLNGEQVKVFPWFSFYLSGIMNEYPISGHGGRLKYYSSKKDDDERNVKEHLQDEDELDLTEENIVPETNDDKVPYRSLAYNYSPNFIIIDFHPDLSDEPWVAHVIENGRLVRSLYTNEADEGFEEALKNTGRIIDYWGDGNYNFKSVEDISKYLAEAEELKRNLEALMDESETLRLEWMKLFPTKSQNLDKDSDEYKELKQRLDKAYEKYQTSYRKIEPKEKKLREEFWSKWIIPDPEEYRTMSAFGEWIEAGVLALRNKKEEEKKTEEELAKAKEHGFFLDRKKEFDEYCKEFKKRYGKILEEKGEEFWEKYFGWCEATEEEKEEAKELANACLKK